MPALPRNALSELIILTKLVRPIISWSDLMQTVSLFDAKTHLSRLIEQIATGAETEIVILED